MWYSINMETIKSIQEDSITITKSEDVVIERSEIKEKISFLKGEVDSLQLALEGRKNDLLYYKNLLGQMPKEKVKEEVLSANEIK